MKLLVSNPNEGPLQHPDFPWYLGSPDAVVMDEYKIIGGVDFKTTGSKNGYGEPGSDVVPDHIACQCHWYMGLTGAQWWEVATLFMGYRREFHIFHLERNQEIIDNLVEAGRDFWENHVIPQVPPEIDASDASGKLLRSLYPESKGEVLPAPDKALEWREYLFQANEMLKKFEYEKKLAQHHLEALVGDADSLLWPDGWRFDWKKQKDRTIIDWENLAMSFLPTQEQLIRFTTIIPGPRVPRLWPPKEKR